MISGRGDDAWYWNSDDTTKTELTNLSELTYDYALEEIAMQRAAEIALSFSHTRPNGTYCFTAKSGTTTEVVITTSAENIAAGQASAAKAFASWQETDANYSGQGHRRSMLSSSYNAIGIACVYHGGYYYWVQEFRTRNSGAAETEANDSATTVSVPILSTSVTSVELTADPNSYTLVTGDSESVPALTASIKLTSVWPSYKKASTVTVTSPTWTSENTSLLSVSSDGTAINALAAGSTNLTASALGTSISVPVTIKPSVSECDITLEEDTYTYDGEEKKPAVKVIYDGETLTENTDYTLTYSDNINAGTATVTITGMGDYAGSVEETFTINKADYTPAEYSEVVVAGQTTTGISLNLSAAVKDGGTLGAASVSGTVAALVDANSLTVSGTTVTFDATSQEDGAVATIIVPVTGCTNYNDYNIIITVTAKAVTLAVTGKITGYTGIDIDPTEITLTITGGTAVFADTLSGEWITNLPTGLTQSVARKSDTEVTITVSGAATAATDGEKTLAITIPAGNLTQVSGDLSVAGGSVNIEKATYELTLTNTPEDYAALTYGYTTGSSVTYTFKNTGNQDITGLSVETTDGFTASLATRSSALSGITVPVGESVTVVVTSDTGLGAGTTDGTITLNWTGAEAKLTESLSQTVDKAALTITADAQTVEYGDTASYTATYSGFVNNESASVLTGTLTFTCSYTAGSDVGTYTVTPAGLSSENYDITFAAGTLTVEKKTVQIDWSTLSAADLVYTGIAKTLTATVGNALNGDVVLVTVALTGDNVNAADAGFFYTATGLTGADSGNYKLPENVTSATYKITPADVVITVADASKTYGDTDPTLTGTVSGTISEDDLAALGVKYTREAGENAGTYTINATYTANSNYTVSVVTGEFTINRKAITVTADDKNSVYGEDLKTLTWQITSGSLASGDSEDDLAVTLTKEAGKNAGTYTISGSSAAANYEVTVVSGTYTIAKAELTVTANDNTITYGDAPADNGAVYSGLVGGDTEAAIDGILTFTCTYSRYGSVGTYTITPSGLSSDNYDITFVSGTLTVEPRAIELVWTLEAEDLTYDGTAKEVTVSIGNKAQENDDVSVTAELTGDNVNVTAEGFCYKVTALAGADSGNYILPENVSSSVYCVTARELTAGDFTVSQEDGTVTVILDLNGTAAINYTGNAIEPDVTVTDGSLAEAGDYTVSYGENTDVGTGSVTITGKGNFTGTLVYNFSIIDQVAPTGELTIDVNKWNTFLNTITFGLFFNKTQTVTVTASDWGSGVAKTEYYLADEAAESAADLANVVWTEFEESFDIDPDITCVVYVKITDNVGNSTIISSDGIVIDATAPAITGIEDGDTYCGDVTFTVADDNLDYVLIDGEAVTGTTDAEDAANGITVSLMITADGKEHTVVAADKAGNTTTATVIVNAEHAWVYTLAAAEDSSEATITETCENCGETASVTIVAPEGDPVYDGDSHDAVLSYSGMLAGGNDLVITYEKDGETVTDTAAAGTYTATIVYAGKTVGVTWTVAPAALTVTANDITIEYGEAMSDGSVTYSGFVGGDTEEALEGELVYTTDYQQGDDAGTYTITPSGLSSDNYVITFVNGTLTVLAQEEDPEGGTGEGTGTTTETGEGTGTTTNTGEGAGTTTETGEGTGTTTNTGEGTGTTTGTATGTNTGDSANKVFWLFLLMFSGAAIAVLEKSRKKGEQDA